MTAFAFLYPMMFLLVSSYLGEFVETRAIRRQGLNPSRQKPNSRGLVGKDKDSFLFAVQSQPVEGGSGVTSIYDVGWQPNGQRVVEKVPLSACELRQLIGHYKSWHYSHGRSKLDLDNRFQSVLQMMRRNEQQEEDEKIRSDKFYATVFQELGLQYQFHGCQDVALDSLEDTLRLVRGGVANLPSRRKVRTPTWTECTKKHIKKFRKSLSLTEPRAPTHPPQPLSANTSAVKEPTNQS